MKTLKKIRKEAPRRLKELRSVCDELIGMIRPDSIALHVSCCLISFSYCAEMLSGKTPEELSADGSADKYFNILEAACESKNTRLMEIGLDAIHFLIGET